MKLCNSKNHKKTKNTKKQEKPQKKRKFVHVILKHISRTFSGVETAQVYMDNPPKAARFPAGGGTRPQLELAITQRFEVEMGRPGGRWKAESQGFPTSTIRASEDITSSSYGRFEIIKIL